MTWFRNALFTLTAVAASLQAAAAERLVDRAAESIRTNDLLRHIQVLALHIAQPVAVVVPFLLVPWLAGALALWRDRRTHSLEVRLVLGFLLVTSIAYFVWFLGFSPTEHTWLRRILNGLALQTVLAVLAAHLLSARVRA